jgi:hypothetical protein
MVERNRYARIGRRLVALSFTAEGSYDFHLSSDDDIEGRIRAR